MSVVHRGSCLCGAIRYEIDTELGEFGYCHCRSCQKASGTAHAANAPVDRTHFKLLVGDAALKEFESSPGKFRCFCGECGSPIYAYLEATPNVLRIRLGSLDTEFAKKPRAHSWVSERAPWAPITDDVPQFDRWASKEVLHQRGSRQELQ
jgi:hypothetical protein